MELVGISPLLMNPVTEDLLDQLRTKTTRPKDRDLSVEEEAEQRLYLGGPNNVPGIPAVNLFACLVEAGRRVRSGVGTGKISTASSTILPSFLTLDDFFMPFIDNPTWVVDKRRGVNPKGGELVCLIRPRFDTWSFLCSATLDASEMNVDRVKELFRVAGNSVGLCDFRPAKRGQFGRFRVEDWQVSELK